MNWEVHDWHLHSSGEAALTQGGESDVCHFLNGVVELRRGWFLIFREVEVGRLVEISTLVKKALNRRS
jgi:hypothetical protein